MYWYLQSKDERPRAYLFKIKEMQETGELSRLPKEDQDKVLQKVAAWDQAKGRNFYEPNEKCYWWFLQPHTILGIRGGNQSGKTTACILNVIMQIEGWHPLQKANMERIIEEGFDDDVKRWLEQLYERKLFLRDPPIRARCVAVDYTNFVNEILGPAYCDWATASMVSEESYNNEKKRKITWNNGSFIHFMTLEQSVLAHGGAARDIIHHDEECSSGIWAQSKMRISTTNGRLLLGMTAEQGVTWTEDEIWKSGLTQRDQTVYAIEMSTYDNPVVSQQMVDEIKKSCTSDAEIDIRIYGKSTPRGGRVYEMARDDHPWVIDPFQIPEEGGHLICAVDPHGKLPHAVLWMWVDYEGTKHPIFMGLPNLYLCAELFEPCNISELASFIRQKETYELGRKADFILCDPSAWNTDQNNPNNLAQQMQDAGIMVSQSSRDRTAGIIKVQEMLSLQLGRDLPEDREKSVVLRRNFPQIMTFNNLKVTRWEREKYRWKKSRQRFTDDIAVSQKPVDKDDHMMENEYRMALFVINGDLEIIEMPDLDRFPTYRNPVIVNGNKMDVDFHQEKPFIEDAYIG